jgi:hypothetical protein
MSQNLTYNSADFDMWFAKTMFRSYLALAVQEEFHGFKIINPQVKYANGLSKFLH